MSFRIYRIPKGFCEGSIRVLSSGRPQSGSPTYIYIYICMYVCMYVHTYIHTYIHTFVCVCVYIYIYICILHLCVECVIARIRFWDIL